MLVKNKIEINIIRWLRALDVMKKEIENLVLEEEFANMFQMVRPG